jgi:hypothetical protein
LLFRTVYLSPALYLNPHGIVEVIVYPLDKIRYQLGLSIALGAVPNPGPRLVRGNARASAKLLHGHVDTPTGIGEAIRKVHWVGILGQIARRTYPGKHQPADWVNWEWLKSLV